MKYSIAIVTPYPNPHFIDVFRSAMSDQMALSILAFDDLPKHRKQLGWSVPDDVRVVRSRLMLMISFLFLLKKSDILIFLGMYHPFPWQFVLVVIALMTRKKVVIATEGRKNIKANVISSFARFFLNSSRLTILTIGSRCKEDYLAVGLTKPRFLRFGFWERDLPNCDVVRGVDSSICILAVGQLIKRKNFSAIIEALDSIKLTRSVELRICGEGEERQKLVEMSSMLNPCLSVKLLGNCLPNELSFEYSNADIFVMPSIYDGWGVALNHAVMHALPTVVANTVRSCEDLVQHGRTGFIYSENKELQVYLKELIDSDSLRDSFARQAELINSDWSFTAASKRLSIWLLSGCSHCFSSGPLSHV